MKNVLFFGGLIAFIVWMIVSYPEIMRKQAVYDCWKAKEICVKYWDVHGGKCSECKEMSLCESKGLLD